MYKMTFDYHTHTTYSDGKGTMEESVKTAISKGLKGLAITDHGPGHLFYGVKRKEIPQMKEEIQRLREAYPQIDIYFGVEANIRYVDNYVDITPREAEQYDFILAGYHYGTTKAYCIHNYLNKHGFLFKEEELREKNTDMVVKAIEHNNIKILTHPGSKGPFDMVRIADACAKHGVWMEISTHHSHLTVEEIKISAKAGANLIISSDAHHPSVVGDFEGGLARAKKAGIDLSRIVNIEEV
ncbi:MAG: PHP domain-containing protein [Anaerovoracaceae bacterium]|jgi:putative hydrolase